MPDSLVYNDACPSRDLHAGAVVGLANGEVKKTESVSGQNRVAGREMIEANPAIAHPDHPGLDVVGDAGLCRELAPLIVNPDRIPVAELTRLCIHRRYPELRGDIVLCQCRESLALVIERMKMCQRPSEAQRQRIGRSLVAAVHRKWRKPEPCRLRRAEFDLPGR